MTAVTLAPRPGRRPTIQAVPGPPRPDVKSGLLLKLKDIRHVECQGAQPFYDKYMNLHQNQAIVHSYRWRTEDSIEDFVYSRNVLLPEMIKYIKDEVMEVELDGHEMLKTDFVKAVKVFYEDIGFSLEELGITEEIQAKFGITLDDRIVNIANPPNYDRFMEHIDRADGDAYYLTTLWHGCGAAALAPIIKQGLKASKFGAVGPGVYLGFFNKASEFARLNKPGFSGKGLRRRKNVWAYSRELQELIGRARFVVECDVLFKDLVASGTMWKHQYVNQLGLKLDMSDAEARHARESNLRVININSDTKNRDVNAQKTASYLSMMQDNDVLFTLFQNPEYIVRDDSRILVKRIHIIC